MKYVFFNEAECRVERFIQSYAEDGYVLVSMASTVNNNNNVIVQVIMGKEDLIKQAEGE